MKTGWKPMPQHDRRYRYGVFFFFASPAFDV
jgi:hypothetical protein